MPLPNMKMMIRESCITCEEFILNTSSGEGIAIDEQSGNDNAMILIQNSLIFILVINGHRII